jgi:hypothetical protein
MPVPLRLRKLIRPLIPDALMARYRLHQHSQQVRTNVEVIVDSRSLQRRWLLVTPDTYRVQSSAGLAPAPDHLVVAPGEPIPAGASVVVCVDGDVRGDAALAARLAGDAAVDVGIVAEVPHLSLVRRTRNEPVIAPSAVAMFRADLEEIGGIPDGRHPLPGLVARARAAGLRLGLAPVQNRTAAPHQRSDPIGLPGVAVLAAVPMHDIGGGGRGAQLALEFLRRGFHVTYVAIFGTAESVDLGLRFVHPHLEQVRFDEFDAAALVARTAQPGLAVFEVPSPYLLPSLRTLSVGGYHTVYDRIDDWTAPSLGGDWYSAEVELQFVAEADTVVASAPDLAAYLQTHGRGDAVLIPNAVNDSIFGVDATEMPADLPGGAPMIIGYHGSLYGDWFDWSALAAVADAYPDATVVVIGDDKAPRPALPANVEFLGLKPQHDLPGYVQRFDVGLIPFVVNPTTHAVSPLKAYEYLASGVPVAAPPLRSLEGLEGVFTDEDLIAATGAAVAGSRPARAAALAAHSWRRRVEQLLRSCRVPEPEVAGTRAATVIRPVLHYSRRDRIR